MGHKGLMHYRNSKSGAGHGDGSGRHLRCMGGGGGQGFVLSAGALKGLLSG